MINFLEKYHEASHLQERPNVDGKSVWKRWIFINQYDALQMTTSLRLFDHFFKRRIVNYILQSNFEETVIVFEEQCFLVTLSFN